MKLKATQKLYNWIFKCGFGDNLARFIDLDGALTEQCITDFKRQHPHPFALADYLIAGGYAEPIITLHDLASATKTMLDDTPLYVTTGKLETMGISIDDMREVGWSDEDMVAQGWQQFRGVEAGPCQWEFMATFSLQGNKTEIDYDPTIRAIEKAFLDAGWTPPA